MCGGTLYRVNGAEEAIDFLGVVVAFEGDEAIAHDLQVFFGFRLEEFEDFGTYFVVRGQRIEIGAGESGLRNLVECRRSRRPRCCAFFRRIVDASPLFTLWVLFPFK